jgi:hypothetical protein
MQKQNGQKGEITIKRTTDFQVTGDGTAKEWKNTDWIQLPSRSEGEERMTKVKILYSPSGIYFLFYCQDEILSATMDADFLDLWKEDVVEVFLWPDERKPAYFEYEISPLGYELPLLISNENGDLTRWMPFHYDPDRKTRKGTSVEGGEKRSLSEISSWTAEFFIPFKLMRPLDNHIPEPGTKWRGNLYRVDYDHGKSSRWSWQLTSRSFHDIDKFGYFTFE